MSLHGQELDFHLYRTDYDSSDDPASILSQWASGNTCTPTSQPDSNCTQGGWPEYVVKATTVRHIQLAVNFARNQNIRLVIKNSGHDFNGKSIGGYSLSVWTHNLKGIAYDPSYTSPTVSYTGRAVTYAAGVQAYEGSTLMRQKNMVMIVAGGGTVGIAGGFLQGGGHSSILVIMDWPQIKCLPSRLLQPMARW